MAISKKGGTIGIQVVRGEDFEETGRAADKGEKQAQQFLLAFAEWSQLVSEHPEFEPHCFSCAAVIRRVEDDGNFGGLAVGWIKHEDEMPNEAVSYACPFCIDCEPRGRKKLCKAFGDRMAEELGLVGLSSMQ